jgi:anthranilate phosphoribosyltransferase
MQQWIKAIRAGSGGTRHLTYDEAAAAAHAMAREEASDAQSAAFLMALRMKGETPEETLGFIDAFRKHSLPYASFSGSLNCGGSQAGRQTFPVHLAVSLLLASVGFPQLLQGGDASPSVPGTTWKELLEGLQVFTEMPVKAWETLFRRLHIGFLSTDCVCPPLGRLSRVREQVGVQSVLDAVEKAMNPVQSQHVLLGVQDRQAMERWTPILPKCGFQTAYLIQGLGGTEDLPLHKSSLVRILSAWGDESLIIDPRTFGFFSEPMPKIGKEEQLSLLLRVIQGEDSFELQKERDHVIFNAGIRLYWFDKVASYEEGFQVAASLLQRKEAWKLLVKWREQSRAFDMQLKQKANSSGRPRQ